ncbi:FAD:protein FMN transferase [Levilactobacillus wangkuiensis]|uniref:FAD:protein FMN transferase n=1 Tax=Levilactobacillus wangkuiensis TaxID=2799566 RepID=UPI0019413CC1|nr:FAD:protein FMN transferase [Levilactobacillus wangkuiensis]
MSKLLTIQIETGTAPIDVRLVMPRFGHLSESTFRQLITNLSRYFMRLNLCFSCDRTDSELCQFQRGELAPSAFSPELQAVYQLALKAQTDTGNAFDPFYAGTFDPRGLLKGWMLFQAFEMYLQPLLHDQSLVAAAINGGGDVQMGVTARSEFVWNVGVESPSDMSHVIKRYRVKNGAMATSMRGGSAIGGPIQCQEGAPSLNQATVLAPSLIAADTLATTAVAMGERAFAAFKQHHHLEIMGLLVTAQDNLVEF